MTPQDWSRIQQGIFAGESGGDYGALYNYQNRPNGRFSGIDVTKMTVDQALDFASPSGPYGQYVKSQVGRVATPMGAYQVVGSTLRDAKRAMGLKGDEVLTPQLQDQIGQWIYKTQGTGAWEGYKGAAENNTETKPMMQEQQPRGLLGSLGIQKRDEAAGGETAQPFYQRDTFKDTAATLAQGFAAMGSMPALQKMTADIAQQRTESKARNKTAEYLKANGMEDIAELMLAGQIGAREVGAALVQRRLAAPKDDRTALQKNYEFFVGQGISPEDAMKAVRSGTTINMGDVGEGNYLYGAKAGLPAGYRLDKRTGEASVIPGGPAAVEAEAGVEKEALRGEQTTRAAGVVLEDIGRIQDIVSSSTLPVTGTIGSLLKGIPGTNAYDASALVQTVAGNIGFDRLQQMRDASPTGGALGAINNTELATLQSVLGSLDQAQSQRQFETNLARLEEIYKDIMQKASAYPNAAEFGFEGQAVAAPSDDPLGLRN